MLRAYIYGLLIFSDTLVTTNLSLDLVQKIYAHYSKTLKDIDPVIHAYSKSNGKRDKVQNIDFEIKSKNNSA